jgi:dTDP-4-amino-4,6-dideoxygalactose transaminase
MPEAVVMASGKVKGIGCSLHNDPLHQRRYFRVWLSLDPKNFPNAEATFQSTISLPIYPDLTPSEVELISSALGQSMWDAL